MSENDERKKRVSRLQQIKDESEVNEATKRIMNLSLESEEQNSTNFLAKRLQKASANTSMNDPQRIQISRIDVDPPNTVRVCSPSPWSNPFRIGEMGAETLRGQDCLLNGFCTVRKVDQGSCVVALESLSAKIWVVFVLWIFLVTLTYFCFLQILATGYKNCCSHQKI